MHQLVAALPTEAIFPLICMDTHISAHPPRVLCCVSLGCVRQGNWLRVALIILIFGSQNDIASLNTTTCQRVHKNGNENCCEGTKNEVLLKKRMKSRKWATGTRRSCIAAVRLMMDAACASRSPQGLKRLQVANCTIKHIRQLPAAVLCI